MRNKFTSTCSLCGLPVHKGTGSVTIKHPPKEQAVGVPKFIVTHATDPFDDGITCEAAKEYRRKEKERRKINSKWSAL